MPQLWSHTEQGRLPPLTELTKLSDYELIPRIANPTAIAKLPNTNTNTNTHSQTNTQHPTPNISMLNISGNELSIDSALTFLEKSSKYLSPQHVKRLQSLTNSNSRTNDQNLLTVSDLELTDLDLLDELRSQMQVIKDLRETLSSTTDTKALQGLISSSNTLFTSIAKLREQVMKQESQRRLETATVAAIKTLEPLAQDKFFKTLETELGKAGA